MKLTKISDLAGKKNIKADWRTRRKDGSLRYPEGFPEEIIVSLDVKTKNIGGTKWVYWHWDPSKMPEKYRTNCGYSGISEYHFDDYFLFIEDV